MSRVITGSDGRKYLTDEPLLHPPKREWVGLTQAEIWQTLNDCSFNRDLHADKFARAIEAKLKEKNT
jgi:hypothetical protein